MRMMDFTPLSRSSIGFDRLFDMLETVAQAEQAENYPPYNIEKIGEDAYRITLAVAGFTIDELSITSQPNRLVVAGRQAENGTRQYLYHGIAGRAFQRQFGLADYMKVAGAELKNGMLSIDLVREVPEAMKPRQIEIAGSNRPRLEAKVAA